MPFNRKAEDVRDNLFDGITDDWLMRRITNGEAEDKFKQTKRMTPEQLTIRLNYEPQRQAA